MKAARKSYFQMLRFTRSVGIALTLIFSVFFSNAQVTFTYGITSTQKCVSASQPIQITFTNTTNISGHSWLWDPGTGFKPPATQGLTFTWTYDKPGVYYVNLTDQITGDAATKQIFVYASPTAGLKVDPSTPTVGCNALNINFLDNSTTSTITDKDGKTYTDKIISWSWEFGDGSNLVTDKNTVNHVYNLSGNKLVRMTLQTENGCKNTISTANDFIYVYPEVVADFSLPSPNACQFPFDITATNASTGADTYAWSITGITPASILNPTAADASISIKAQGTYQINLTAKKKNINPKTNAVEYCSNTNSVQYIVPPSSVKNDFSFPTLVCENSTVKFINKSSPAPATYDWYVDGVKKSSTSLDFTYTFTVSGSYKVRLDETIGLCNTSNEQTIVVNPAPTVTFNSDKQSNCNFPFNVNFFNSTSSDVVKKDWDFGDGGKLTENTPSFSTSLPYTYNSAGNFNVSLTVYNTIGCSTTATQNGYIKIQLPTIVSQKNIATGRNLPDSGCVPFTLQPNVQFNVGSGIVKYEWQTVDPNGNIINTFNGPAPLSQVFNNVEIDTLVLKVTTASGCSKQYFWPIRVGKTPNPFDFNTPITDKCASETFPFNYLAPDTILTSYKWTFSDGTTSNQLNPTKKFNQLGKYDVSLTGYLNGCPRTVSKTQYVTIKGVIASFTPLNDCSTPYDKKFKDNSTGIITDWSWDFGDGNIKNNTSKIDPEIHTYVKTGSYSVKLKVSDGVCNYDQTSTIYVANEANPNFTFSKQPICIDDKTVSLSYTPENASVVKNYDWNYGCGFTGATSNASPSIDLTKLCLYPTNKGRGTYSMQLKVTDQNGCVTYSQIKSVDIRGPVADYSSITPINGCQNLNVLFQDKTNIDPGDVIVSRFWDWGDGKTENILTGNAEHTFSSAGNFTIKLTVTDNAGCVSSVSNVTVSTSSPVVDFAALQLLSCPGGQKIQFDPTSSVMLTSYVWDLGDGIVKYISNPSVTYTIPSKKSIRLTVRDVLGCEITVFKPNYITIDVPKAKFSPIQDVSECPPFNAEFAFEGQYAQSYLWDFGDGSTSNLANPTHLYTTAGTYPVTLQVTSPGGCISNSTIKNIVVKGSNGSITFNSVACEPYDAVFNLTSTNTKYVTIDYGNGQLVDSIPYSSQIKYRYSDTGFYQPRFFFENDKGCRSYIPVFSGISAYSILPVFKPDITFYCDQGVVKFTDLSLSNDKLSNWTWDYGDGSTGLGKTSSHLYTKPGIYNVKLKVTSQNGCENSTVKNSLIEIQARPDIDIYSPKAQICEDDIIQFQAWELSRNNSANVKWFWDFANGTSSDLQVPPLQQFRKSGAYPMRLYATNDKGCNDTVNKIFNVAAMPLVKAGLDTFLCLNKPIQLQPTGAAVYVWDNDATLNATNPASPTVSNTVDKTYYVTGKSIEGCSARDSILVRVVKPTTVSATGNLSICLGESSTIKASGTELFTWTPSTGLTNPDASSITVKPSTTTTYTVTGKDKYGCFTSKADVAVKVNPLPTVDAGKDTTIMAGYPYKLRPTYSADVIKYEWVPSKFLDCANCKTPETTPMYSTTYTLYGYTADGCMSKDVVNIYATCTKENLFIPNTFSPNADGMNDVFYPRGIGIQQIKAIRIFSRTGQLVFEKKNFISNDVSSGWNGMKGGLPAISDVYVYFLELVCENGNIITLKGDVTLVR